MSLPSIGILLEMTEGQDVFYRPVDNLAAAGWAIRAGASKMLLCEGPGNSSRLGHAIFNEIVSRRESEPEPVDGGFLSRAAAGAEFHVPAEVLAAEILRATENLEPTEALLRHLKRP